MEELALISDIHGNLPALEAVLKDISDRNIDKIICLGDVIGKGPSNPEAIDICKQCCETILRGNWEEYVASFNPKETASWIQKQIGVERLEYIRTTKLSIEFWISGKLLRLFHASPNGFKRVFANGALEEKQALFIDTEMGIISDMAGYADIHKPYMQTIDGKTLFNIGSVGNPLDIPVSSYVILKGCLDSKELAGYSIEFIRVPYNINQAVEDAYRIKDLPALNDYISEITNCQYNRKSK